MFAPWKKSYDQPRHILKSRDITLPTKVHLLKAMVFSVVKYGCNTDVQNSLLDSVGEGESGMLQENSIETCILPRVKQITSPGSKHETSARTWYTGKTQRDRVERELGGGIGMGNTCKSMADSCRCMTKPLQYCQVISLQLIKKRKKKNKVTKGRMPKYYLSLKIPSLKKKNYICSFVSS